MKYKDMNKHQQAAFRAIKKEFNWLVGGWYNCYQDGYEEDIPELQKAKEQVYEEAMSNNPKEIRFAGEEFCRGIVERLFATDEDAEELWGEDGVVTNRTNNEETKEDKEMKQVTREEARAQVVKNYTVKEMRETLKAAGIKGISRAKKEQLVEMMLDLAEELDASRQGKTVSISKVNMYAFTGMFIGEFDAEVQDGKILVNTSSRGELMFDLNTGKEVCDEAKARWANRVEAV